MTFQKHSSHSLFGNIDKTYFDILTSIKSYFLRQDLDCPYMQKEISLYNLPVLEKISEFAIITDNFILIHENAFKELINSYSLTPSEQRVVDLIEKQDSQFLTDLSNFLTQKENEEEQENIHLFNLQPKKNPTHHISFAHLDFLAQNIITTLPVISFIKYLSQQNQLQNNDYPTHYVSGRIKNPFVYMSDKKLLDYLNQSSLNDISNVLKEEISHIEKNSSSFDFNSYLEFSKSQKRYMTDFGNNQLSTFLFNYNILLKTDLDNANLLLEYFTANLSHEIKNFSPLSFGLVINTIYSHEKSFKSQELMDKIVNIISSDINFTRAKRRHLVDNSLDFFPISYLQTFIEFSQKK